MFLFIVTEDKRVLEITRDAMLKTKTKSARSKKILKSSTPKSQVVPKAIASVPCARKSLPPVFGNTSNLGWSIDYLGLKQLSSQALFSFIHRTQAAEQEKNNRSKSSQKQRTNSWRRKWFGCKTFGIIWKRRILRKLWYWRRRLAGCISSSSFSQKSPQDWCNIQFVFTVTGMTKLFVYVTDSEWWECLK